MEEIKNKVTELVNEFKNHKLNFEQLKKNAIKLIYDIKEHRIIDDSQGFPIMFVYLKSDKLNFLIQIFKIESGE